MSNFSQEILDELTANIDEVLINYFNTDKYLNDYGSEDIRDVVESVLNEKFETVNADVRFWYEKERNARKKKRTVWASKTIENAQKYPSNDPKSYFYSMRLEFYRNSEIYREKYGTSRIEDIISIICQKEIAEWKKAGRYLVEFPNFPNVGRIHTVDIFRSDIFVCICKYIIVKYNGNMNNFNISNPAVLYENGIFSVEKGRVQITPVGDDKESQLVALFLSNGYELHMEVTDPKMTMGGKIPVFDAKDREILSYLINSVKFDPRNPSLLSQKETVTLNSIASAIYKSKNTSSKQLEDVEARLNKMVNPIQIRTENSTYNWTLLSTVSIVPRAKEDGSTGIKDVEYVLGSVVSDAIIRGRVIKVSSFIYDQLENTYSKSIYCILQLERLKLALNHESLTKEYQYMFFKQKLLIRTKQIRKNMSLIEDALKECVANNLVIESYTVKNDIFTLTFIPLSEYDKEQLVGEDGYFLLSEDNSARTHFIE